MAVKDKACIELFSVVVIIYLCPNPDFDLINLVILCKLAALYS